jgi:hypothetical protein
MRGWRGGLLRSEAPWLGGCAVLPSTYWFVGASPFACFVAGASPKACGGPVRRFGGAVGAERADCPSVLGLAAPSRNSLRAVPALRSDKRDENVDERASRWAASPARLGAPQARRTRPPQAWGDEPSGGGVLRGQLRQCGARTRCASRLLTARSARRRSSVTIATPERRGRRCPVGAIWRRAEERSRRGGARSALRKLTFIAACPSVAPAGRAASSAMRPGGEHRRSVGAFSARPSRRCEPPPGCACRDARQRQGSSGRTASQYARHRQGSPGHTAQRDARHRQGSSVPDSHARQHQRISIATEAEDSPMHHPRSSPPPERRLALDHRRRRRHRPCDCRGVCACRRPRRA